MLAEKFISLRPALYHLTARSNLARIQRERRLYPAADLFKTARRNELSRKRRKGSLTLPIESERVLIRDQDPLHEGNCGLAPGFSFEDLVALLNRQVYFWPGDATKPISYGMNHFGRYAKANEDAVVLVFPTRAVIDANPDAPPRCCQYNSGSPRCVNGRKSPRGPDLFVPMPSFALTPGRVVELTYDAPVDLPWDDVTVRPVSEFRA